MKRLARLSATIAFFTFASFAAHADTITLRGDVWCPYNCEPSDTAKPGYVIEIAKEVFGKAGHTVDYQTLNWARTLEKVKAGEFTAAIGASKDDARELHFGAQPVGISSNVFAIRSDDSFTFKDMSSLNGKVLGVINGYSYAEDIDNYIKTNKSDLKKVQASSGDDALSVNLKKLVAKRVDLVLEDGNVLADQIATQKLDGKVKLSDTPLSSVDIYLAFGASNPKAAEYAALLDKGIEEMRASGKLAEILKKYGIKDWKK